MSMVVGFECPDCGFKSECTVTDDNKQVCRDCGMEVSQISGDGDGAGTQYDVTFRKPRTFEKEMHKVAAGDAKHAFRQIKDKFGDDKEVLRIEIIQ